MANKRDTNKILKSSNIEKLCSVTLQRFRPTCNYCVGASYTRGDMNDWLKLILKTRHLLMGLQRLGNRIVSMG